MKLTRIMSLDESLLKGFEYPVALVVEVTKKGVILSKLRYLKALGQVVNETIRCPSIEVYAHMDDYKDSYLEQRGGRPIGIDWVFRFGLDGRLFNDTLTLIRKGELNLNLNNPQIFKFGKRLLERLDRKGGLSFRRLDPVEQGMLIEPYCNLAFQRAGDGRRLVLQNVEVMNTEPSLRTRSRGIDMIYTPEPAPHMEIDLLVITEISTLRSILDGIRGFGFAHDRGTP
ncbi:MAG: hypothetical protein HZB92_07790 [Euryarchaeota archaeon]|nr:hypothetical protein [Euryarchaeota archaeon]